MKAAEQQVQLARSPVSAHDLDAARAAVTQADAALDMAKIQLGRRLSSPRRSAAS